MLDMVRQQETEERETDEYAKRLIEEMEEEERGELVSRSNLHRDNRHDSDRAKVLP